MEGNNDNTMQANDLLFQPDWDYTSSKTWVKGFLNVSMMVSNIIDLCRQAVISNDRRSSFWALILVMLSVQIVLQANDLLFQPDWDYTSSKTWVKGFLNVSMMVSNIIDLCRQAVISNDRRSSFWALILVMLSVQIVLQVIGSVYAILLAQDRPRDMDEKDANVKMNKLLLILLFFVCVLHMTTSGIMAQETCSWRSSPSIKTFN